jgi:hypothetical protein
MRAPYLSVVVAARNDNHGGNMIGRMQAFLDSWIAQAKRYDLDSEIIVVEWNPPADRPKLRDALRWPADISPCDVRFVEVAREVHDQFPNAGSIPLHQMIAKNAGIRRARGEFVLATNLDIIFSAAMMKFLGERRLERGSMYRTDRIDVASDVPAGASVDELLAFCESHALRVFAREGGFRLDGDGLPALTGDAIFATETGIRLARGWHDIERSDFDAYRWMDPEAEFVFERPRNAARRLLLDVEAGPSAGPNPVTLEAVDPAGAVLATIAVMGRALLRLHLPSAISVGRVRLRVRGEGLPLLRDLRILHLRVLGMEWETAPDLCGDERQVRFPVRTESGAALRKIEVDVRDTAGQIVVHAAGDAGAGEHTVTIKLDFALDGSHISPAWRLEIVRAKRAQDWSASYHAVHPMASEIRRAAYLHTHACGDFTLLARSDWFALRGYAEFPIWPMHIDALFCYAAFHAGVREEILRDPMRAYHIEHLSAAGWTPEGEAARSARLAAKGLSEMQYSEFTKWVNQMRRFNAPIVFTLENWGLAGLELPEVSV